MNPLAGRTDHAGGTLLAVMPECYDGSGGIAQYGRDLIDAWTAGGGTLTAVTRGRPAEHVASPAGYDERRVAGRAGLIAAALWQAACRRPDAIVCGHMHYLALCCAMKRLTQAPLLVMVYGIDAYRPLVRMAHRLLRHADVVVAISRHTRRCLLQWADIAPHRIRVLPNAIRLASMAATAAAEDERHRRRAELGFAGRRVILCLGRMDARERYKGHDVLLEALVALRRDDRSWLLVFAGGGDDQARLQARAAALGLAEALRLEGYVSSGRRADLLRAADVLAMPSAKEGFGFAFLEAMAAGTPVVGGDRDGARDALRDGQLGVLVDPFVAADVGRGILAAIERPRGLPPGIQVFAFEHFQRRLSEIVRSIRPGAGP